MRFRAEVALGRFDDAIRTAKTMFAMSRHLGEHPTLIGNLVGIADREHGHRPAGGDAGAAGLPQPLLGPDELAHPAGPAGQGHGRRAGDRPGASSATWTTRARWSADQIEKFIADMDMILERRSRDQAGQGPAGMAGRAGQGRGDGRGGPPPPGEHGLPEERLLRFPPEQVLLLDEKREYEVRRDDVMKLMTLALLAPRRKPVVAQVKRPRAHCSPKPCAVDEGRPVGAQARLDQRIALLRHVEALRLYAAEHDGTAAREAVRDLRAAARRPVHRQAVPLRTDRGHGAPPRQSAAGAGEGPVFNVHYELTVRK